MTLAAPNRVAKTYFGSQIWLRSLIQCLWGFVQSIVPAI